MEIVEKAGALGCMLMDFESLKTQFQRLQLTAERVSAKGKDLHEDISIVLPPLKKDGWTEKWIERQIDVCSSFTELSENYQGHRWFRLWNYVCLRKNVKRLQESFDVLLKSEDFKSSSRIMQCDDELHNPINYVGDQFKGWIAMVREWLEGESYICGVCGVGGIGKTSLLEDIYYRLESDKRYRVCWVDLTNDITITQLQDRIASTLKVQLAGENRVHRKVELLKILKSIENLVIILDNLSDWIPLLEVGIPIGQNSCKIIIATRSVTVCRAMQCEKCITMEYLGDEASWQLFVQQCGELDFAFAQYAQSMVKKCGGLPLAILELARCMRGVEDVFQWKDMSNIMLNSIFDNSILQRSFEVFQSSYLNLENSEIKDCFLCCSLFPYDSAVERKMLIRVFSEGDVIKEVTDTSIIFYRVHSILNKLENIFFVESVIDKSGKQCIEMHPLIRDFGRHILKSRVTHGDQEQLKVYEKWEIIVLSASESSS